MPLAPMAGKQRQSAALAVDRKEAAERMGGLRPELEDSVQPPGMAEVRPPRGSKGNLLMSGKTELGP